MHDYTSTMKTFCIGMPLSVWSVLTQFDTACNNQSKHVLDGMDLHCLP